MHCLSLRLIIGGIVTVSLCCVASVTLSLTVVSGLKAVTSLADRHTWALSQQAHTNLAAYFNTAIAQMDQISNLTRARDFVNPSDDPDAYKALNMAHHASFVSVFRSISALTTYYADNTRIMYKYDPRTTKNTNTVAQANLLPSSITFGPTPQVVSRDFQVFRFDDGAELVAPDTVFLALNASVNVIEPAYLPPSYFKAVSNAPRPIRIPPVIVEYNDDRGIMVFGTILAGSFTTAHSMGSLAGAFSATRLTYYLDQFHTMLRSVCSTPNSIAVAYDPQLVLLASSISPNVTVFRGIPPSDPAAVPKHCSTYSYEAGRMNCRLLLSETGHPLLRHLSDNAVADLVTIPRTMAKYDVDGDMFYAGFGKLDIHADGDVTHLLVAMPQSDVIGTILYDTMAAAIIACVITVVTAAMAFGLIHIILRPLTTIAERMQKAANFEDDEADGTVSSISEVAALQEAYYALNDELNRIRSFVPQSVLAAKKVTAESSDDDANLASDVVSYHSMASRRSDGYQNGRRKVASSSGKTAGTTNTGKSRASSDGLDAAMVARKQVSIVCANLNGLHKATMANLAQDAMVTEIGMAVAAMESAVSARQGVLSFHGDRMLATFNAARPCAQHASKAASAAVAASHAHNSQAAGPLRLMLSCGVSTGSCVVGSLGSDGVKSFSVVGTAVTEAAVLERLTRAHDGVAVLATHRTCMELAATASAMCTSQYVDLVALRGRDGVRPVAVAALTPKATSDTAVPADEWMYVLDSQARTNASPFDGVFELLQSGDVRTAVKVYDDICAKLAMTSTTDTADGRSTPLVHPDGFVMTADATTCDGGLPNKGASCNGALPARLTTIMQHARQALAASPTNNTQQQQQTGPATSLPLCRDELFGVRSATTH
jgi:hypothetical protein